MRLAAGIVLLLSMLGCVSAQPRRDQAAARVDHLIIGVSDLDRAVQQIEDLTGVRPAIGGVHPGRGTRNGLMSLGNETYLELLTPDPAQSVDNEEVRQLRALTEPRPIGWAVSAGDAASLRRLLAASGVATTAPEPGSRTKPDGGTLHWVSFDLEGMDDPQAPFFIVWSDRALHPSRTSPGGCSLAKLGIGGRSPQRLQRVLAPLVLPVNIERTETSTMRISLNCPKGRIDF